MNPNLPMILFFAALTLLVAVRLYLLSNKRTLERQPKKAEFRTLVNAQEPSMPTSKGTNVWMQVTLSLIFAAAALYVILSENYDEATQKWAFGTIGLILGFWLKP